MEAWKRKKHIVCHLSLAAVQTIFTPASIELFTECFQSVQVQFESYWILF